MKQISSYCTICLSIMILFSCNQAEKPLSVEEQEKIKEEIITAYGIHIQNLMNLDYEEAMKFYPKDHIIFGDGKHWGGYNTIDGIWKKFTNEVREMIKWDLDHHQVFIHSRNAASYLVEYENWRIDHNGDTTKVNGSFTFGMQKYPDGWKSATQNVTHHYTAGPNVKDIEDPSGPFQKMPIQVGIAVSDFDKSLDFYTNVLGMTEVSRFSATPDLATKVGLTNNKGFHAVVLKFNDQPGAAEYKLVKIQDSKREPFSHFLLPGLRYITIHVKDIDPWVERLKKAEVPLLNPDAILLPDGRTILNFLDPDGALVEIIGP